MNKESFTASKRVTSVNPEIIRKLQVVLSTDENDIFASRYVEEMDISSRDPISLIRQK